MDYEKVNIPEIFGSMVFNDNAMRDHLPKAIYRKLRQIIDEGREMDPSIADDVAHAMKDWAIDHGATHYSHWFQPLNGVTAEKHDSFISIPDHHDHVIMEFSGKELVRGEPDASSFPSGGLRSTFEARGYTTWDCTSPAFLRRETTGVTLYIPTAFCSYTGEALDQKTPLLRSMQAINTQALRILRLFGNTTSKRVIPQVGPEQEYFLIDKEKYLQRKDLMYTGRTLFGAMPPKGQEMDDHYFGAIRPRVGAFMKELNERLWKLGVPSKTQHNEVAPAQHELAQIYEEANIACDHNQMVMEAMKRTAANQGLTCLLAEKPFAGINGSGKHNNWSLATDDGINMTDPGKTPHENIQFLLVLGCILKAVDEHAGLLRQSAAVPGNDHRLGAAEAPPAIISVFLGEQLEDVIHQLIDTGAAAHSKPGGVLKTGVNTMVEVAKDATDRNRTSPFAFTGNKFEFRMVGSSASISNANVVLNTIAAEAFRDVADELEKAEDFSLAVHDMIKKLFTEHQRVIFSGNGYSAESVTEAERRGLPHYRSSIESVVELTSESSVKMFRDFGVYTKSELESRAEIEYETYAKTINIEAKAMLNIAGKQIIPAVVKYTTRLAESINAVRTACPEACVNSQMELLKNTSRLLEEMRMALHRLREANFKAAGIDDMKERAMFYLNVVVPEMQALRTPADKLEMLCDKDLWPFPSYGDMLFEI